MSRVTQIGARLELRDRAAYRSELESMRAPPGERPFSQGEMASELARRAPFIDIRVHLSADLSDGDRVIADDRYGAMIMSDGSGGIAAPLGDDEDRLELGSELAPSAAELEEDVRDLVSPPGRSDWRPLIAALADRGINIAPEALDTARFVVEVDEPLPTRLSTRNASP